MVTGALKSVLLVGLVLIVLMGATTAILFFKGLNPLDILSMFAATASGDKPSIDGDVVSGPLSANEINGDIEGGSNINTDNMTGDIKGGDRISVKNLKRDIENGSNINVGTMIGDVTGGENITIELLIGNQSGGKNVVINRIITREYACK